MTQIDDNASFLEQIEAWNDADEHQKIIDAIEIFPPKTRTPQMKWALARAYNNLRQCDKALAILDEVGAASEDDWLWHYRRGFALFYLWRFKESRAEFETVLSIQDDDDAQEFIDWCDKELAPMEPVDKEHPLFYRNLERFAVTNHIEETIGTPQEVVQEVVGLSEQRVDIEIIPPTKESPYQLLVTVGMGAYTMPVPPELGTRFARAELCMALPAQWDLSMKAPQDESEEERQNRLWPFFWLKTIARFPREEGSWLGWGHTLTLPEQACANTNFKALMLVGTPFPDSQFLTWPNGETVYFYQVVPLFADELRFKTEHGTEALLERFTQHGVSWLVDPNRHSVVEGVAPTLN